MDDALARVLRLVADGRLSAEEAAPILDALQASVPPGRPGAGPAASAPGEDAERGPGRARVARVEIREGNRRVVDLRIPISLGRAALDRIPGLPGNYGEQLRAALQSGMTGPVVDVADEDGDGIRIVLE
jgi:hypothetical protein